MKVVIGMNDVQKIGNSEDRQIVISPASEMDMKIFIQALIMAFPVVGTVAEVDRGHLTNLSRDLYHSWTLDGIIYLNLPEMCEGSTATRLLVEAEVPISCLVTDSLTDVGTNLDRFGVFVGPTSFDLLREAVSIVKYSGTDWFVTYEPDFVDDLPLRLDSKFYVLATEDNTNIRIDEIYAIKNGPKIRQSIAEWNTTSSLTTLLPKYVWERRKDLGGVVLRNTAVPTSSPNPVFMVLGEEGKIRPLGYAHDLLLHLGEELNFRVEHFYTADRQYGIEKEDGTWNGMIGDLIRGDADLCISGLHITQQRNEVIDFSNELVMEPISLVMKRPDGQVFNVWAYMVVFEIKAWATIAAALVALAIGVTLIAYMGIEPLHKPHDSEKFGLINGLGFVVIALLQRDYHLDRFRTCTKILVLVTFLFGFIFFAYYSAVLTSEMTVAEPTIKLQSFHDVLDEGIKVVTLKGSSIETILVEATQESPLYKIYHEDMKHRDGAFLETFSSIFEAIMTDETKALYGPIYGLSYYSTDIIALSLPESIKGSLGMGMQKNSEFRALFNFYFLKLKQSGVVNHITNVWFNRTREAADINSQLQADSLSYNNLLFPSLLLGLGVLLALAVAISEKVLVRIHDKTLRLAL